MKKVTVIVATYNQQDTIGRTLDSILSQRVDFPYEILIGEDGSSDNTRRICLEYQQKFPEIIRLMPVAPNKGIVDNYFDCILAAEGEYLADCAGDDYWTDPMKLQKQVNLMDNMPDVVLCHTDWQYDREGTLEPHRTDISHKPDDIRITEAEELVVPLLAHENMPIIHLCTALYRRDTIVRIYDESPKLLRNPLFSCEDLQIAVSLAAAGRIAYLPDVTLAYSVGHSSISSPKAVSSQYRYFLGTLRTTHTLRSALHIEDRRIDRYYIRVLRHIASVAFRSKDNEIARDFMCVYEEFRTFADFKTRIYRAALKSQFISTLLSHIIHG